MLAGAAGIQTVNAPRDVNRGLEFNFFEIIGRRNNWDAWNFYVLIVTTFKSFIAIFKLLSELDL